MSLTRSFLLASQIQSKCLLIHNYKLQSVIVNRTQKLQWTVLQCLAVILLVKPYQGFHHFSWSRFKTLPLRLLKRRFYEGGKKYKFMMFFVLFTANNNVSNDPLPVTDVCLGCICEASSGCDRNLQCNGDTCGLFRITWVSLFFVLFFTRWVN